MMFGEETGFFYTYYGTRIESSLSGTFSEETLLGAFSSQGNQPTRAKYPKLHVNRF